ncbi:unnamed protein product, partial [Arctogadus glacialis]
MKAKLEEASARVRKLQREKINGFRRENRAKNNMQAVLEELKEKSLINEELKDKLECYSDLPVHLLSRQGVEQRSPTPGPRTGTAQTLINSVAVALRTLQDVGYAEFKDWEATSELIK